MIRLHNTVCLSGNLNKQIPICKDKNIDLYIIELEIGVFIYLPKRKMQHKKVK